MHTLSLRRRISMRSYNNIGVSSGVGVNINTSTDEDQLSQTLYTVGKVMQRRQLAMAILFLSIS